ncbi:MAG: hypothetical protein QOG95_3726 [Mycobacterium sp.]|jgi:hypothetical protein|nr:hypothetical protein [Mycobacterium sp.]
MLRRLSKGLVARIDAAGSLLLARFLSSSPLIYLAITAECRMQVRRWPCSMSSG